MNWNRLPDGRTYLPEGSIIRFTETGSCYEITGPPVGYGGSGILYPAVRVRRREGTWEQEEMRIALKECYPIVPGTVLERDGNGEVYSAYNRVYAFAREQMLREKEVTGRIFNRGFRLVPIVMCSEDEEIAADGEHFCPVRNLLTLMERLDEKGVSLGEILRAKDDPLTVWDMIRIMIQVLASLKEVHEAGYIHGDIQANNLFIKGYDEEDRDAGMVTLIDFGAARKLEEDGLTAPIADRALFTTEGYAPPECIYENDGTLRLDVTADLYAAGYLLLRMVTGKDIRRSALELVTNERYLYQRRADQIGCPPAAAAAVNRVLGRALHKERSERYPSAQEMMKDLERIERALSPSRSAIASTDYRAFISYCHSPENDEAAQMLQRSLEHWRIPRMYRTQRAGASPKGAESPAGAAGPAGTASPAGAAGPKGTASPAGPKSKYARRTLGKIFLDKEELASSPDLAGHLDEALEHSEYLIVLLSPETKESPWVNREIGQFLTTHTRDRILTVLVSGSAHEGLPPLLEEQDMWKDGKRLKSGAEGLAADIRADSRRERKKKLKTEILRLAAPMLGCGYDDLRQREKEYRGRRLLQVMSAAILVISVIAGIVGWEAVQIRRNYRQVLTARAHELAQSSRQLLAAGDREGAVEAAMLALPEGSSDKSKPLVLEAQGALADAMHAYQGTYQRTYAYSPDRTLKMPSGRSGQEALSPDGKRFAALDESGNVRAWELETGTMLWEIAAEDTAFSKDLFFLDFLDEESVLLAGEDGMRTVNLSGEVSSLIPFPQGRYEDAVIDACAFEREQGLLAVWQSHEYYSERFDAQTGEVREDAKGFSLGIYRITDGSTIWEDTGTEHFYDDKALNYATNVSDLRFSPDGRFLAAVITHRFSIVEPYSSDRWAAAGMAVIVDLEDKTCIDFRSKQMRYLALTFAGENRLAVFGIAPDINWEFMEPTMDGEVRCLDAKTGKTVWEHPFTCQLREDDPCGIVYLQNPDADQDVDSGGNSNENPDADSNGDRVVVWAGRDFSTMDGKSGETVWSCIVPDKIVGCQKMENRMILGTERGRAYRVNLDSCKLVPMGTGVTIDSDRFFYEEEGETCIFCERREGRFLLLRRAFDRTGQEYVLNEKITGFSVGNSFPIILLKEQSDEKSVLHYLRADTWEWMEPYVSEWEWRDNWFLSDETACIRWKSPETDEYKLEIYDFVHERVLWERTYDYTDEISFVDSLGIADSSGIVQGGICMQKKDSICYVIPEEDGFVEKELSFPQMVEKKGWGGWEMEKLISSPDGRYQGITFHTYDSEKSRLVYFYRIVDTHTWQIEEWDAFSNASTSFACRLEIGTEGKAAFYDEVSQLLCVLDLETKEILCRIPLEVEEYHCYYTLADQDRKILTVGKDGYLKMYDAGSGELLSKSRERYTQVYGLSEPGEGIVSLEAFDDSTREYIGSTWFNYSSVRWFFQIDEDGNLCRMGKTVGGIYNDALRGVISADFNSRDHVLRIWKWHTLDDLLEMGREYLSHRETALSS